MTPSSPDLPEVRKTRADASPFLKTWFPAQAPRESALVPGHHCTERPCGHSHAGARACECSSAPPQTRVCTPGTRRLLSVGRGPGLLCASRGPGEPGAPHRDVHPHLGAVGSTWGGFILGFGFLAPEQKSREQFRSPLGRHSPGTAAPSPRPQTHRPDLSGCSPPAAHGGRPCGHSHS